MLAARNALFAGGGALPPPTYTSISPSSGKSSDTVTITGTNFVAGGTSVAFGSTAATNVNVSSPTSLTCTVPNLGTTGTTFALTITTSSGSVTTGNVFTYFAPPTISSFNPGSRTAGTSGNVTIAGTNFVSGQTSVTVDGIAVGVSVTSATELTASFPSRSRGTYQVAVTTPGGTATANYSYTLTPTLTSVTPSSVYVNQSYTFTVTGTNFISSGANAVYTDGSGYPYKGITVNSETSLTFVNTYTSTGTFRVDVVAPDGWSNQGSVTVVSVPAPSISGATARNGGGALTGSTVTVSGNNFAPGVGTTSVSIGGTAVSATVSNTSISFTCPNLSTDGSKTISVTTAGGTATGSIQFWAARSATVVVNTQSSGSYTPPAWANFMDVVVRGGGGGGGSGVATAWGGGGSAGRASVGTIDLVSTGWASRSYTVGGGGPGSTTASAGSSGGASSLGLISALGGAGGCSRCNGAAGAGGSTATSGLASSPAPTGGTAGNSAQPGPNPGSGGGGGNSALGPFAGITGRAGAVIIAIRQ